jgi:hypothetical protein
MQNITIIVIKISCINNIKLYYAKEKTLFMVVIVSAIPHIINWLLQ